MSSNNAPEALLSLADIARHFSLPESTARYYCKRFAAFMPIHGEGRRKRYGHDTLQVITMILECLRAGKTAAAIEAVLSQHFACATESLERRGTDLPENTLQGALVAQGEKSAAHYESKHGNTEFAAFAMHILEQQNTAMQSIAKSLEVLSKQQEDMQNLREAALLATEENTQLRQEVHTLKSLLHSTEQVHQDDLTQVRTWMSRLARSYNNKAEMDTKEPR